MPSVSTCLRGKWATLNFQVSDCEAVTLGNVMKDTKKDLIFHTECASSNLKECAWQSITPATLVDHDWFYVTLFCAIDLWLWVGASGGSGPWPHRVPDRVRGDTLVQGSRDHAQLQGLHQVEYLLTSAERGTRKHVQSSNCIKERSCLSVPEMAFPTPLVFDIRDFAEK